MPLVLNVSDQGTQRTQARAAMFDDLPYDYYAALPPWYQPMTPAEVTDYFVALADTLARPLVIYNAPWVCNQLTFAHLRKLAEHPRIVGCKDVTPSLTRALDWPAAERRASNFSYLHGTDQIATSTELGADGFVSALSNALPELAVAIWDAARADDAERAFRLQSQFLRIARATGFGPMHACLEAIMRHRGFLEPDAPVAAPRRSTPRRPRRVVEVVEAVGVLPGRRRRTRLNRPAGASAKNRGRQRGADLLKSAPSRPTRRRRRQWPDSADDRSVDAPTGSIGPRSRPTAHGGARA